MIPKWYDRDAYQLGIVRMQLSGGTDVQGTVGIHS